MCILSSMHKNVNITYRSQKYFSRKGRLLRLIQGWHAWMHWTRRLDTIPIEVHLSQGLGTYGSRVRCGSFNDGMWFTSCFLNMIVMNETFSVFFHLPDYKAISNTMQHQKSINSKKHVIKEKIQTFTIV